MRMLRQLLIGLGFLGAALIAVPASANTINIAVCQSGPCGTVTDGGAGNTFYGFLSNGSTSTTNAFAFNTLPTGSNPAAEAAYLNTLAGTSFTAADEVKTNLPGGTTTASFNVPALAYFLLKLDGPNGGWAFFQSMVNTVLNLTYTADPDGTANGFSHYAIFASVPVPAGLGLLASGLLGLGGLSFWRRKRAIAAV